MMLAYQPVRSLATLNIGIQQGLSGASRVIPIIDEKQTIKDTTTSKDLIIDTAKINFENVKFDYSNNEETS